MSNMLPSFVRKTLVSVGILYFLLKLRKWTSQTRRDGKVYYCTCHPCLSGKLIVLISAYSRVGYEVALSCAKRGATVVFGVDDILKGERILVRLRYESGSDQISYLPLDLSDMESCKYFAILVRRYKTNISLLILNADERPYIDWQMNFFGLVIIVENLKSFIGWGVQGNKGIIFVSSAASVETYRENHFTDIKRIRNFPFLSNCSDVHEADVKYSLWFYTVFLAHTKRNDDYYNVAFVNLGNTNTFKYDYEMNYLEVLLAYLFPSLPKTPTDAAQTVIHCINTIKFSNGSFMENGRNIKKPYKKVLNYCYEFVSLILSEVRRFVVKKPPGFKSNSIFKTPFYIGVATPSYSFRC